MKRARHAARVRSAIAAMGVIMASACLSYPGKSHETLTFLAAQRYNQCATTMNFEPLTPLEIRYIAKANSKEADRGLWDRLTKRDYFEKDTHEKGGALSFLETRMGEHYDRLVLQLNEPSTPQERFRLLGQLVHYIQKLSSPVHIVPIRVTRLWRARFVDRFDRHPVNREAVLGALLSGCEFTVTVLESKEATYVSILEKTASETRESILQPIPGLPITWEAFWKIGELGSFGSYGVAGNNFGRHTEFRCQFNTEERCLLLEDDPLYLNFATERHAQAVMATVHALLLNRPTDDSPEDATSE